MTGKLALWRALRLVAGEEPALDADRLERLAERAKQQQEEIESTACVPRAWPSAPSSVRPMSW